MGELTRSVPAVSSDAPQSPDSSPVLPRCAWARTPLSIDYHDAEWGKPLHDEHRLFELLVLEGAQAGLSWETVLRKRARYRELFDEFDPAIVASYGKRRVARLLADEGIIRNRLKIEAAVTNARAFLDVQKEFGSFDTYVWRFVGFHPRRNAWHTVAQVPASTPESDALSKDLARRGFRFVGTTICYAFMQAAGLVNDHVTTCFRYSQL